MKMLISAVLGLLLVTGCATSTPPEVAVAVVPEVVEVPEVAETKANSIVDGHYEMLKDVKECALEFMTVGQSHVLDATQACSHIYGLRNSREARTTELQ